MQKKYKAVFFDWDGTAVFSRKAPADAAVEAMRPLLQRGVKLAIISGTTIENLAGGKLAEYFTAKELENLYLGLGRGAYNYNFQEGQPFIFKNMVPPKEELLTIHRICFEIHQELKEKYDFNTDIVFSRPNYCKIDLIVENVRGENLFMQENELDVLKESLRTHGISGGLQGLINLAETIGEKYGIQVKPTCDAKYLEVGTTSKSDNVDCILNRICSENQIFSEECVYFGDEFVGIEPGIFGSDSFMQTEKSRAGDFFDVSEVSGERPEGVKQIGGGVEQFLDFLRKQADE